MAAAPASSEELIDLVRKSGVADDRLDAWVAANPDLPPQVHALASQLVEQGLITQFHARHMLAGKYKGFVLGGYRVLDQIGAGGMGVIFLAEHLSMKRRVAIKVLPSDKAGDHESRERFYREARIVAALDHPNVVHAYDIGQNGDTHYIVMEYIEGQSLEQMLRERGPLPPHEAAEYIAQAARGLQHAHERGLVHRDIKPGNMLLDKAGVIKILDMGLGRFFEESSTLTTELCSGSVIGTADYMAPEQAVNSHDVDIRADIYSLGISLYALLTGDPPYASLTVPQKLLAHHMRTPEPIQDVRPDIPDSLAEIVMRMLEKKPEDRYQTPGEVADALTNWLKTEEASTATTAKVKNTIIQRKVQPLRPSVKASGARWKIPAIAAGVVALLGIGIAVVAMSGSDGAKKDKSKVAEEGDRQARQSDAASQAQSPLAKQAVPHKIGQIRTFDTKGEVIERIALSPSDSFLAGGSKGNVRVWFVADEKNTKPVKEFKAHNGQIWGITYSPKGDYLATCGQDGTIALWNTATWKEHVRLTGIRGSAWSAVFSPDGQTVFGAGDDGIGRFWNVADGQLKFACDPPHEKDVRWVARSPDGESVYTAGSDGTVRGYDARTGKQRFVFQNPDKGKRFQLVAVSPDGARLLCGSDNSNLFEVETKSGTKVGQYFADKLGPQWCAQFAKSDPALLVSSGADRLVRVWDVESRSPYFTFEGHTDSVPGCAITADAKYVFSASKDKTVRMWALPERPAAGK